MTINWQVTATTVFCEAIAEEVTLMVYRDGSIKCTGFNKYSSPDGERALKQRSKMTKRDARCGGPECDTAVGYRDKLFAEEAGN